jgi:hypothetical protein
MELLDLNDVFDNDRTRVPRTPGISPDDLHAEWRETYQERAAIRELSGGLPRELAEHYALLDTLELMRNWDKYPTY